MTISAQHHSPTLRGDDRSLLELADVLGVVSGKWIPALLCELAGGPKRNFQLRHATRGISAKALSDSLRRLVRDGLVTRVVHDDGLAPAGLGYALTPFGDEVIELLAVLDEWTARHYPTMVASRSSIDDELEVS
jgi:DNA-binding HxlR family transcriptional regulator